MMPPQLKEKYLARLRELVARAIEKDRGNRMISVSSIFDAAVPVFDAIWPKTSPLRNWLDFSTMPGNAPQIGELISHLQGTIENLELGLFEQLAERIEAEIAGNYIGQAESLLGEGASAQHGHIPAAVLAGAVLERHLRELCAKQTPPVDTVTAKGEPKTMDPIISDLVKAGAILATKAAMLRAWAAIRNKAAHDEWDKFSRSDVEQMVKGVTQFVAGL